MGTSCMITLTTAAEDAEQEFTIEVDVDTLGSRNPDYAYGVQVTKYTGDITAVEIVEVSPCDGSVEIIQDSDYIRSVDVSGCFESQELTFTSNGNRDNIKAEIVTSA